MKNAFGKLGNEKLFYSALIIIGFIKLWVVRDLKIRMIPRAGYDDFLFISLADSITQGNWLGKYSYVTLVKGPMYPIFLAIGSILKFPTTVFQHSLYITAIIFLVWTLRKYQIKRLFLLVFFTFLVFNPITYAPGHLRIVRDFFYTSTFIMLIASLINLTANDFKYRKSSICLGSISGFLLFVLWYTREEGVLILPVIFSVFIYVCLKSGLKATWDIRRNIGFSAGSLLTMFLAGSIFLSGLNLARYGTSDVIEMVSGSYVNAYKKMTKIQSPKSRLKNPVPRDARLALYKASPSFRKIKPFLDPDGSTIRYNGTIFMWKFRKAVKDAGFYSNPDEANGYYDQLANEIDEACSSGELDCRNTISINGTPFRLESIPIVLRGMWKGLRFLCTSYQFEMHKSSMIFRPPLEFVERMHTYQKVTNDIYTADELGKSMKERSKLMKERSKSMEGLRFDNAFKMAGWVSSADKVVSIGVVSSDKEPVSISYTREGSIGSTPDKINAKFELSGSCAGNCDLVIVKSDGALHRRSLFPSSGVKRGPNHLDNIIVFLDRFESKKISLDRLKAEMKNKELRLSLKKRNKLHILRSNQSIYQIAVPWLVGIGIAAYLSTLILCLCRKKLTRLFATNTLILIAIVVRLGGLAYVDVFITGAFNHLYLSLVYPLLFVICLLSVYDLSASIGIGNIHRALKIRLITNQK